MTRTVDLERIDRALAALLPRNDEDSLQAIMAEEISELRSALARIADGDGYYGAQAREYKEIARKALHR